VSRATERFVDKREAILDGAARLFNQHGIGGALLSELAQRVGLATNSLTYYYRKKEDLACACLQRSIDAMGSVVDAAARQRTLDDRIRAFIGGYLALLADIAEGRHAELIVFSDLLALAPQPREPMTAAYTQMFRRVRALLDAGDGRRLEPAVRNARAHLLLSTVSWTRAWVARYETLDYARVAAQIADIVLNGIASPHHRALATPARPGPPLVPDEDASTATRAAYLRAATRLVNEYGYRGASVDRIAAELRLTKGSFYHHHETKDELIAACFERTFAVMRAAQSAAQATPGSGLDRLAMACRLLLDYQMSRQGPLLRVTAWTGLPAAIKNDMRRTMARLGERFAALVVDGMADGSLRVVDPSIAAQVINGLVNAAAELQRWVSGAHEHNAFELYAMPLFSGLRPGGAHAPLAAGAQTGASVVP
jgi:AcrR family transcriptional regulator